MSKRRATIERKTGETDIQVDLVIDGEGKADLETGVPFLTHMLNAFAKHGHFDLTVKAQGDTWIDDHHTTEDIGICLGRAFQQALGDKIGIRRYGNAFIPMDDALAQAVVDLSNRPHVEFRAAFPTEKVGTFDVELVREFMVKFAQEARMNLHIILHYGDNTHHMIEAIFKAVARALDEATSFDARVIGVPSTKGLL